jgi:two-component system, OmpR family, response regulator MtrA
MSGERVLVVEDDPVLTRVLQDNLVFEGFTVRTVGHGLQATGAVRDFGPDLVLLDVSLPGRSGFELCAEWRRTSRLPIILLTAKTQKPDKVRGLQLGADDYVTKPFDLEELLARIRAVLRRTRPSVERLQLGVVTIDFAALSARRGETNLGLTHRELQILQYLAERPNIIVSRDELLRAIWHVPDAGTTRAVDHAIARLRKKIEETPHQPRFIHTVHGDGYVLAPGGRVEPLP